jgi:hypothetical protein
MFPAFSLPDLTDQFAANPEVICGDLLTEAVTQCPPNIFVGQLGPRALLSPRESVSLDRLCHIFEMSSQAQVGGLDADGAITGVQDVHPGSDRLLNKIVSHPAHPPETQVLFTRVKRNGNYT